MLERRFVETNTSLSQLAAPRLTLYRDLAGLLDGGFICRRSGSPLPGLPCRLSGPLWPVSFVPLPSSFVRTSCKGDALYSALFISGLDLGLAPEFVPERPPRQVT